MTIIPKGDVYCLIVRSKLPAAEQFERWVFDEVIPSIRKYGAYVTERALDWGQAATQPAALFTRLPFEKGSHLFVSCSYTELTQSAEGAQPQMQSVIFRSLGREPQQEKRGSDRLWSLPFFAQLYIQPPCLRRFD